MGYAYRPKEDRSSLRTWGTTVALETDNESGSEEGNNLTPKCNKDNTYRRHTIIALLYLCHYQYKCVNSVLYKIIIKKIKVT